jgi:hypothetical protein
MSGVSTSFRPIELGDLTCRYSVALNTFIWLLQRDSKKGAAHPGHGSVTQHGMVKGKMMRGSRYMYVSRGQIFKTLSADAHARASAHGL